MTAGTTAGSGRRGRRRAAVPLAAAALLAGCLTTSAEAAAAPRVAATGDVDGIPVRGSLEVTVGRSAETPPGTVVVHGVRRIEGGTVVYYSLSTAPGGASGQQLPDFAQTPELVFRFGQYSGNVALSDGENAYLPLLGEDPQGTGTTVALTTRYTGDDFEPGAFYTAFVVMPPLPADVDRVDVMFAVMGVVQNVPVEDGPLTPTVDGTRPVPLGAAWPAVDPARVAAASAEGRVLPLERTVEDVDRSVRTTEKGKDGTVDLSSDVLFAVDQATLTPRASAKLAAAAKTINEKAAGGRIVVTGHTDSTGAPAHNLDLSRRRARAVEAALHPLVTVPGVTFVVDGKGETEPVADNGSAEGRRQNRRVSVEFTIKGA